MFSILATLMPLLAPIDLRCEYLTNPLAIDSSNPRLSWLLESEDPRVRAQSQSAYQILVATAKDNLTESKADLWNTGKILTDETNQIPYHGKRLASSQTAWWIVRTWNSSDKPSNFSAPAFWRKGLSSADWKAAWIGYDAPDEQDPSSTAPAGTLEGAHWIWISDTAAAAATTSATKAAASQPAAPKSDDAYFRRSVDLNTVPQAATLVITADNHFDLFVNGIACGHGDDFHTAASINIAPHLRAGANTIAVKVVNVPDSPAGLIVRLRIDAESARPTIITTDATWKVARKPAADWNKPGFDDSTWQSARPIAALGDAPWGIPNLRQLILPPPPYLRKTFTTSKPVKSATLYATALGVYEIHLNGQRVGDYELAPGWTDFHKRVHYQAYDVTSQLRSGKNALAAVLADGWYDGYLGYTFKRHNYGGDPRLLAQLQITFKDGSTETILTDHTWRAAYGPLREADLLMGATYDARREIPNWDHPDFDDSHWRPVTSDMHDIQIQAHPGDPVRKIQELPANKITEPKPNVYVFDLGQNMVGVCRLRLSGSPNHPIRIRYAEMLNPDGTLYTTSLRAARATDTYIPSKEETVTFQPPFTFHGFRYVELTGLSKKPDLDDVTGIVLHSDMRQTSTFECSNQLVNQLVHNIIWGQKGNYLEIPTDCPQRDERLGWTGDANFFIPTATYNFDVAAFFTKWLVDLIDDSQMTSGGFTHVAPALDYNDGGATAWQDAAPICAWTIWQRYNDTQVIRQHYASLKRYMEYLHNTSKDYIRNDKPFGDWLNLDCPTKSEVIGTAYYAHVAHLMSEMAAAIGAHEDARTFADLSANIRAKFIKEFLNTDGSIKESSQTAYAFAFTMNLLPDEMKSRSADRFVEEIKKKNWHLATGFIGTARLLPALTSAGRSDIAYKLLLTDTFPSWLYPVTLGATTMWERWDGWRPDKGFQDPAMNSFNHYGFGAVGQWLYDSAAGIRPASPGYKTIALAPHPDPRLTYVKSTYRSINGLIESNWFKTDNGIEYDFTIPVNTTATIVLQGREQKPVEVGSGRYQFFTPD